jgi:hypothetical protein
MTDEMGLPNVPGEVRVRGEQEGELIGKHVVFDCVRCQKLHEVPIAPLKNALGFGWTWDGNEEAPTLSPSVDCRVEDGGCGWHGWIRAGKLEGA